MRILLIGYRNSKIFDFLSSTASKFFFIDGNEKISLDIIDSYNIDYIILHGCHSILSVDIVKKYKNKIINHHGAYLPYNRGAHPNVWSFIDNTPKGGTIHYIDESIDGGNILVREEVEIKDEDTLADVYWRIRHLLEEMFISNWDDIVNDKINSVKQKLEFGHLHYRKDLKKVEHLLVDGWDTLVIKLINGRTR